MPRKLLIKWMEQSKVYRVLHASAANDFASSDSYYKVPAIIITALSAGLAFSVQVFPHEVDLYIPVLVGMLNLVAGVFTSICSFKRLPELAEANRIAAIQFSKLHRKITEKLTISDKEEDINEFTAGIREDMDSLIESGPSIPENVIRAFMRKNGDTKLSLPTIVTLGGLEISHNTRHSRGHKSQSELPSQLNNDEMKKNMEIICKK
jgi:hypothetical protein